MIPDFVDLMNSDVSDIPLTVLDFYDPADSSEHYEG